MFTVPLFNGAHESNQAEFLKTPVWVDRTQSVKLTDIILTVVMIASNSAWNVGPLVKYYLIVNIEYL